MLVSPERGIYKQPENNKEQENGMEEMLAPMEEMDEDDEKQRIEMGRRRKEPGSRGTGIAPGGVGPPTGTQERNERNSLGSEVAAENQGGEAEEGEEGRKARGAAIPYNPSRQEREEHELTHTPYRSWCDHCVRARGRNQPHQQQRRTDEEDSNVPRISFDYFFFSQEDQAASNNPMIVMLDESTGEKYARKVDQKGLGDDGELEWLIQDMAKELRNWGYHGGEQGHVIFKSDGESSIRRVRDKLAKAIGGRVVLESPPRRGITKQRCDRGGRQDGQRIRKAIQGRGGDKY